MARMRIGGEWRGAEAQWSLESRSPGTGAVIGYVPRGSRVDVDAAVAAARRAAPALRRLGVWDRSALCRRVAEAIRRRQEPLAQLLSLEQGKPLHREARGEVAFAIEAFEAAAERIKWLQSSGFNLSDANKRGFTLLRPRGVYGVITPWNFPLSIPCAYYFAPGLAAGNAFVWVAAPSTSLVSSLLMECIVEADLPAGSVNFVSGEGEVVGRALASHPDVDAVAFTGSTPTGKIVAACAAGKPVSLELGGNGPTIVLGDADLDLAAARITAAAFTNAGQICTSTERVIADARVYDGLAERVAALAAKVVLGVPADPATTMGPVHNEAVAAKVDLHLEEGAARGAAILFGGGRAGGFATRLYHRPAVIVDVHEDSLLNREETFGPVVPLLRFSRDADLERIVAKSRFGLFGSIFTQSIDRAFRCAEWLKVGTVHVNEMSAFWELGMPAGGASGTSSGTGRIGMAEAIRGMSDEITLTLSLSAATTLAGP